MPGEETQNLYEDDEVDLEAHTDAADALANPGGRIVTREQATDVRDCKYTACIVLPLCLVFVGVFIYSAGIYAKDAGGDTQPQEWNPFANGDDSLPNMTENSSIAQMILNQTNPRTWLGLG